jgi:hypothetical protein
MNNNESLHESLQLTTTMSHFNSHNATMSHFMAVSPVLETAYVAIVLHSSPCKLQPAPIVLYNPAPPPPQLAA